MGLRSQAEGGLGSEEKGRRKNREATIRKVRCLHLRSAILLAARKITGNEVGDVSV